MKKKRIYIILAILAIIFLFTTAALCNQCQIQPEEEALEEKVQEEDILEEKEGKKKSKGLEEGIKEELYTPTIDLKICHGPEYSSADGICYYRIEAIVAGNPNPEVEFSKDDSHGAWGDKKCQVNLKDPTETYTLIATATNSVGSASDSITIYWNCSEGLEEEEAADESEEIIIEEAEAEATLTMNIMMLHASDIGYIVYPSGINTSTLIIGDSISNTDVRGYFAFDLSPLKGKTVTEVKAVLKDPKIYGDPSFKGNIGVCCHGWLPLGPEDYSDPDPIIIPWDSFLSDANPIEFDISPYNDFIQRQIEYDKKIFFRIKYFENISDGDGKIDGREYSKENISLIVKYED